MSNPFVIAEVENEGFKSLNTSGTAVDLATEAKLEAVRVLLASLDAKDFSTETTLNNFLTAFNGTDFATQTTLAALLAAFNAEDFASETTLASLLIAFNAEDFASETTLAAFKAAFDSEDFASEATLAAFKAAFDARDLATQTTLAAVLAKNTEIDAVLDTIYTRQNDRSQKTQLTNGTVDVTVIEDTQIPAEKRLQTEARLAPGSTVNIGTGIPSNPADLVIELLKNGGSSNMLVNGSGSPVAFSYGPGGTDVVSVEQVLVVFTADDFEFDGTSFGPNTALTNGIKFETFINGVLTEIFNIKQNEDFLRVPGRIPLVNNTGPKDVLACAFGFAGLVKLDGATSDQIRVTIRDNLTSVKLKYLTATLYGAKE